MKYNLIFLLIVIQIITFVGCKKSSDATPEPEVQSANLEVSSFTVVGERDEAASAEAQISSFSVPSGDSTAGYVYTINLSIAETRGVNATVTSIEFSFYNEGTLFGTYTPEVTSMFSSSQIGAGTNVAANEKRVASGTDDPYADEIQVVINYTDGTSVAKTATATYNGPQYEDADIYIVEGTVKVYRLLGLIFAEADVENRGTRDATSYTLLLYFYDSSNTLVNLMIKEVYDTLPINGRSTVEGLCTTSLFKEIVAYTWQVSWTKADGTQMSKRGNGTL